DLVALLVQEKMIVAEVRTRHMPMEVLRFQVEREHIREQGIERPGNVAHSIGREISRRRERRFAQFLCFLDFHGSNLLLSKIDSRDLILYDGDPSADRYSAAGLMRKIASAMLSSMLSIPEFAFNAVACVSPTVELWPARLYA